VYRPEFVPQSTVEHVVVLPDGARRTIPAPVNAAPVPDRERVAAREVRSFGPTVSRPLGTIVGARSGDKGGDANLGVWTRTPDAYPWLVAELTVERLRELLPECRDLTVDRYELPGLCAVNFVVRGLLGQGVAASTRFDPQAKALGEWLRSRHVEIPEALL
jgi:hypothetical protein